MRPAGFRGRGGVALHRRELRNTQQRTCCGQFVRPYSGSWVVFTFHLHSLPALPAPTRFHLSHTCSCQMSRPGEVGGREGRTRAVGQRSQEAACDFYSLFLLTSRRLIGAVGPFGERLSGRMSGGDTTCFMHCPPQHHS